MSPADPEEFCHEIDADPQRPRQGRARPSRHRRESCKFKGNGRPTAAVFHANIQIPLMRNPKGVFTIHHESIEMNRTSIENIDVKTDKDRFDKSFLAEF